MTKLTPRERYATDPEYREKRKALERERRKNWTPEQRAEHYLRRKIKMAQLSEAEYAKVREKQREKSRKWRAKKKAEKSAC